MSAKKDFETKILEDESADVGYNSGPLSEQLYSEEFDIGKDDGDKGSSNKEGSKVSCEEREQLDSGLDLSASLLDSDVKPEGALPTITVEKSQERESWSGGPLAFLFQQDEDGDTQLHIGAIHGCEKTVGTLIRICPDKEWLNVPNDHGQTALHLAVLGGNAVVTRMLVIAGTSLALRDRAGETPLHVAVTRNRIDCLQALLAPVTDQSRKIAAVLNQKNYQGQMCVHLAATSDRIEMLKTLVHYGADINGSEGLAGWTPLHIAALRGNVRLAQYLVKQCNGVDVYARDYGGRTPRRYAKRTAAAAVFTNHNDSSTDSEDDDDDYDSDSEAESLFERLRLNSNPINVA